MVAVSTYSAGMEIEGLGARFRQLRVGRRLTQQMAADGMGMSLDTLKSWEARGTEPGLAAALRAARFYGCTLDWLAGRSEEELDALSEPPLSDGLRVRKP